MSAALKVPKNTGDSIILKWKKFGTTKTLPTAGHPTKLSNQGRRALVTSLTKNPMVTLEETWHHPYGEAWWWEHRDVWMFFSGRDWETSQNQRKDERRKVQRDP
uniref:Uncharacterized protein n=1 Tax=Oncorhynchus tshawytscha TaxID=74940 RepID=A0AAZ3RHD3_ONCTS